MKKTAIAIAAIVLVMSGCVYDKPCNQTSASSVELRAFNDKHYIWQTWTATTNEVDNSKLVR